MRNADAEIVVFLGTMSFIRLSQRCRRKEREREQEVLGVEVCNGVERVQRVFGR